MRRALTVLLAMATVLAGVGPAVAMAETSGTADDALVTDQSTSTIAQQETTQNETPTDSSDNTTDSSDNESVSESDDSPPGATLAGTLGAHRAEHEGELERRTLGVRLQNADDASKAQILEQVQERLQTRTDDLEQRRDALQRARDNGTISESQYRVRVTQLAAETNHVRTMANESEHAADGLPADVLAERNVNVTALQQVRERAGTVTGTEMAEIARQIAGENVGTPMGPPSDRPGHGMNGPGMSPTDGPENGPDVAETESAMNRTTSDDATTESQR